MNASVSAFRIISVDIKISRSQEEESSSRFMVREAGGQTRSSSSEQPALIIIPSMRPSRRREVEVTRLDLDGPV
jgi:hypothetical protein